MVRAGTLNDVEAIVDMAREFWSHTIYDDEYCPESVNDMALQCASQGLLSVVEVDKQVVGFACGIKGALLGNNDVAVGVEVAWWINTEHRKGRNGIALLKHLEQSAKDIGIKYWNMSYMESSMPEQVKSMYERLGYKRVEVMYSKTLQEG